MRIRAAAATDIGMVRERNEDSYLMEDPLFAVADGMGGHLGGEVASRLAVETLEQLFRRQEGVLADQVQEANRAVFERSILDRSVSGMGTTLTVAIAEGDRIHLAHVGDSRAYLFREGVLRLLTEDHTLVHRMVQEGEITEQEAEVHPQRNILTRVIGVDLWVDVDEDVVEIRPGDRLLLCTDGLTGMLREEQIRDVLASGLDPDATARELVRLANDAGGVDNITVVLLDVEEGEPSEVAVETVGGRRSGGPTAPSPASATATHRHPTREAGHGQEPTEGPAASRSGVRHGRARGAKSPVPRASTHPWARIAVWTAVVTAVVVAAVVGTRMYLDRQWYVGVSDGNVAVFRGIPTSVAGLDLHHVVEETSIPADQAEQLALWQDLDEGITADDRAGAEAIVEQIRRDVASAASSGGGGS
ncbi:MAG: Stp1/IreP family PP2C-type Ser/Thr phosphatase [Candidatus Velamenicoccus archaeovorus]